MNRQFVSEVGVYMGARNSRKGVGLVPYVKTFEYALLSDDKDLPAKELFLKIKKLCSDIDRRYPRTNPLIVEHSRRRSYRGAKSIISISPSHRDGSPCDNCCIKLTLLDVKADIDFCISPVMEKGGEQ